MFRCDNKKNSIGKSKGLNNAYADRRKRLEEQRNIF